MSTRPRQVDRHRDDPEELDRYLQAYIPSDVSVDAWRPFAPDAIALVKKAGRLTRGRVEKDIQLLGAVAARLRERNRPLSLDEALGDSTLLDFDLHLARRGASDKTRENRRGILRRLQAAHRGLPWRQARREDGERIGAMPSPDLPDRVASLVAAAHETASPDAAAFLAVFDAAQTARVAGCSSPTAEPEVWRAARSFAEGQGLRLTQRNLTAAVTHEVLFTEQPVALLVLTAGLTRRDLDLALTHAAVLPDSPSPAHRALLRGAH